MKLSQQIYNDFLKEIMAKDAFRSTIKTRTYEMSYDYLIDLIKEIEELENPPLQVEIGIISDNRDDIKKWLGIA